MMLGMDEKIEMGKIEKTKKDEWKSKIEIEPISNEMEVENC
jgi:hypothetical protein